MDWMKRNWRKVAFVAGVVAGALCPVFAGEHVQACTIVANLLSSTGG